MQLFSLIFQADFLFYVSTTSCITTCLPVCSTDSFAFYHDAEMASLISDSLTHLHIFRPQESSSLQATLDSVPSYLLTQHSLHVSANRPLGLIAINDLSAFLWQDRLDADEESDPLNHHPQGESKQWSSASTLPQPCVLATPYSEAFLLHDSGYELGPRSYDLCR